MGMKRSKDERESLWATAPCTSEDPSLKTQPPTYVPPHSAPQPPAAHTQSRACCCSGTSMDEEPLLEEKGNSMNDCFW